MAQAKKVFTMYGKYSDIVTYEYRGKQYDVEYAKDWSYYVTPAYVQHRNAREKIDAELDTPKAKKAADPIDWDKEWKDIYNMMGWD